MLKSLISLMFLMSPGSGFAPRRMHNRPHGTAFSAPTSIEVIFEDDHLIAVQKPAGVVSMPCESASSGTAAHMVAEYILSSNLFEPVNTEDVISHGIVHRLDKEVSGLLLLAKNKGVSKQLSQIFSKRSIDKTYIAIVYGEFRDPSHRSLLPTSPPSSAPASGPEVVLSWPLLRRSSGKCGVAETPAELKRAKPALTTVNVLVSNSTYSILEVTIDTGRFHQIRAHLAHAGYPIVGDKEYSSSSRKTSSGAQLTTYSPSSSGGRQAGGRVNTFRRTMLHSFSMHLVHPMTGKDLALRCPLPLRDHMSLLAGEIVSRKKKQDVLWWLFDTPTVL